MNAPNVLIIADEPDFAKNLMARWHAERSEPAFTLMSSDLWNGSNDAQYEVTIVGPVRSGRLTPVLKSLDTPLRPTMCLIEDSNLFCSIHEQHPRVLLIRKIEGWLDAVVAVVTESLRRVEAQGRARKAEQSAAQNQRNATLGKYMLDQRHSLNNALTSVLGNAELLLMQPEILPTQIKDQLETIHSMSMRMHEIIQRFSSLETEMNFAERHSLNETKHVAQSFMQGT
ncbi:MAG: histidine kinase dimerization/phospho-acceptor domain-containing protein [Acidobacteriaceae bacterium]